MKMGLIDSKLEAAIGRDRLFVMGALVTVVGLSWIYLAAGAGMGLSGFAMTRLSQLELAGGAVHTSPAAKMMGTPAVWTPGYAALMFLMWWIMMVAMMLPSASPAILLFASIHRKQRERGGSYVATSLFVVGYLAAWAGFSFAAAMLQWGLARTGILSVALVAKPSVFGGVLLLTAGLYQITPLKRACLRHCRSPVGFFGTHWRPGARGALRMGLLHGVFCVGCCWFLMGLMFIGGVMNLYWISGLAVFVFLEKTIPAVRGLGYATGVALSVWGAGILALAF